MTADTSRPTGRRKRKRNEWANLVHLSLGRVQIRWTCPACCTLADGGAQIRHRSEVLATEDAGKIRRAELQADFLRDPATVCPEWLAAQQAQAPAPPVVHTIQEAFVQCWLELEEELSPTTLRTYEGNWNRHLRGTWGPREVKSVRAGEISAWRAQLGATYVCHRGKAPRRGACNPECGCRTAGQCNAACGCSCGCSRLGKTAINESMAVLSAILAWCVEHNWVETNEVIASHARRRRKRGRLQAPVVSGNGVAGATRANRAVADWKCAHALVLHMPDLFKLIPLIAAYAGLRPSEILGLRRCDVDVENCQLLVVTVNLAAKGGMKTRLRQKGGTAPGREVPIPQELMDLIVEFLKSSFVGSEEDALLFPSPRPKKSWGRTVKSVNTRYVARMVELARTAAGLSSAVTLNALRKAGENIVKDAVGGKEAALWAGHDLVVAEASYHLARTRVTMPKEVQKALASAWRIAAADLGDHDAVRTASIAS